MIVLLKDRAEDYRAEGWNNKTAAKSLPDCCCFCCLQADADVEHLSLVCLCMLGGETRLFVSSVAVCSYLKVRNVPVGQSQTE